MTVGPVGATAYRTRLVLAASATALSAVIGLVDAVHPLPLGWVFVRAGIGMVLELALLALLVRWLGERQRRRGAPRGRLASLTPRQQWLLAAVAFLVVTVLLVVSGAVMDLLART